jgi:hypothetical protein
MPVIDFTITSREPYAGGQPFGQTGAYERIEGRLTYAVDPGHPMNAGIVDLHLVPRDAQGRVRFSGDVSIFQPADPARGNGALLIDVPNRGRRLWPSQFNRASAEALLTDPCPPGDGFLMRHGYAVADVAWQWDVLPIAGLTFEAPVALEADKPIRGQVMSEFRPNAPCHTFPLANMGHRAYGAAGVDEPGARLLVRDYPHGPATEIPRSRWHFARGRAGRFEGSPYHVFAEFDLEPGRIYSVVYTTEGAPVAGAGLLALRDAAVFLREGGAGPTFDQVYSFGASQSGRILRHLLSLGLNRGESGGLAFDGVHVHIAGGQRGEFNHRFAQPSVLATPGFGHRFPFAAVETTDPHTGERAALSARLREQDAMPRVVATNTSWEYWRGDASLIHTTPDGAADLPEDPDTRTYHFAGTQHVPGGLPQLTEFPLTGDRTRYGFGVVEHTPLTRAAFVALDRWVREGVEPPPSRHPRLADGTAVSRAEALASFPALPGLVTPDPERLPSIHTVDLGERAAEGIGSYPARLGGAYAAVVSAVDGDGNETSGIRLPDVATPVGTHTGWNLRAPETGAPEQTAPFVGFTSFFAPTRAAREATGDPRPSIEERYASREDYAAQAGAVADQLVQEGYLLAEDTELVLKNALRRLDATGEGSI